tara:strand:+ start:501 stop:812 length:312 start_codon:yes stop_codon:yes gene_type:complete
MRKTIYTALIAAFAISTSVSAFAAQVDKAENVDWSKIYHGYIDDCLGQERGFYAHPVDYDDQCRPVQYFPKNATPQSMRNVYTMPDGVYVNYYDMPGIRIILK